MCGIIRNALLRIFPCCLTPEKMPPFRVMREGRQDFRAGYFFVTDARFFSMIDRHAEKLRAPT